MVFWRLVLFVSTLMAWVVTAVPGPVQQIDLPEWLVTGKLRPVNRDVTKLQGDRGAVHLDEKAGPGVVWMDGTDFAEGTIEVDVRGREVFQKSFVGIAFHRKDDNTYEAVYVRPFNFHSADPVRHRHAVEYIAPPDYDWPRLRQEFPGEFENSVDPSITPAGWVHLRILVSGSAVETYVGLMKSPTLKVRKLGQSERGMIGLWTGNGSDGDFANLRITAAE